MAKTKKPPRAKPVSKRGRKKGQQLHIPTLEPAKNNRIHPLAVDYVDVRDSRMDLTKDEIAKKNLLLAAMVDEGLTHYEYDDIIVDLLSEQTVKVRKPGSRTTEEG